MYTIFEFLMLPIIVDIHLGSEGFQEVPLIFHHYRVPNGMLHERQLESSLFVFCVCSSPYSLPGTCNCSIG